MHSRLGKLLKEGQEMCRILSAITSHPASHEERRAIMEQRVKENGAQRAYDSARQALFTLVGWGTYESAVLGHHNSNR